MLKSIRQLERSKREVILAEIALEFTRPSFDERPSLDQIISASEVEGQNLSNLIEALKEIWPDSNDPHLNAVTEIFKSLNLRSTDRPQDVRSKILGILGREIRTLALDSSRISNTRKRLGQKGILPPSGYQIKFAPEFLNFCVPLGITRKEVIQAIEFPEMYQHFIPEIQDNGKAISLYLKKIIVGTDLYTLIVDAFREGDVLSVHFAIRAYHPDFPIDSGLTPTELLKEFTNKYGFDIAIGAQKSKLILGEIFANHNFSMTTNLPAQKNFITRASTRSLSEGRMEVSLAYGVDIQQYANYLKKHGVKVAPEFL